jgi:hypothetical protein
MNGTPRHIVARRPGARVWIFTVTAAAASLLLPHPLDAQQTLAFSPGMVVTSSARIEPGVYAVAGPGPPERALITVRGSGIVLDLAGVELRGLDVEAEPDRARGTALRVDGGQDVTIRGGIIRGYRFGILAQGARNLRVLDVDLSHNWKPRLFSQVGHESLVDWLSFHDNENREWMRFGAALYLEDVTGGEIRGVRAVQGMNGLLMTRTDSLLVVENDFSYNSGLGAGMYRSRGNVVVRNRFDFDVRGYSEGHYQRGQDSAGILVYEQSSGNIFAHNSATHSGDGFFLWAGRSTMDTGEGGANDNLLFHNDFSWAPTNAVEVTFSRNRVVGNYLGGSRYGVWGGYSWDTEIRGNCFYRNQYGVAIEHGQDNRIQNNRFDMDSLVVSLWSRESEPADWGYARLRDTRSRGHRIVDNVFAGNAEHWRLERTGGHDIGPNTVLAEAPAEPCDPRTLLGLVFGELADSVVSEARIRAGDPNLVVASRIPGSARAALPRSAIVVDEWGPFDGRSPKLWPVDTAEAPVRLRVLGPEGRWRVIGERGVERVSPRSGSVGDTVAVVPAPGSERDWRLELEYVGAAGRTPRGTPLPAGEPVSFDFERFHPTGPWEVRYFAWSDPRSDPDRDPEAFDALFRGTPLFTRREARFDYQWYAPRVPGLPQERWAAEAVTRVQLDPGAYTLRTISDDGIRVWVDGELVIDRFDPHGSQVDHVPIEPGPHEIRVRYFQLGGWTEARVEVVRGLVPSAGSPGPH